MTCYDWRHMHKLGGTKRCGFGVEPLRGGDVRGALHTKHIPKRSWRVQNLNPSRMLHASTGPSQAVPWRPFWY